MFDNNKNGRLIARDIRKKNQRKRKKERETSGIPSAKETVHRMFFGHREPY